MDDTNSGELTLVPPDPEMEALKVNLYEYGRVVNGTLSPLFPYLHKGAIVPCLAVYVGGEGHDWRMFKHFNDVDEVVACFGSKGAITQTGFLAVGARDHFVNVRLKDKSDPDCWNFMCITQRQWDADEPQRESVSMVCENCQEPMLTYEYEGEPTSEQKDLAETSGAAYPFPTSIASAHAAELFNKDPDARVCEECGHVNEPFPMEYWGWHRYAEQAQASLEAANSLKKAFGSNGQEDA